MVFIYQLYISVYIKIIYLDLLFFIHLFIPCLILYHPEIILQFQIWFKLYLIYLPINLLFIHLELIFLYFI